MVVDGESTRVLRESQAVAWQTSCIAVYIRDSGAAVAAVGEGGWDRARFHDN